MALLNPLNPLNPPRPAFVNRRPKPGLNPLNIPGWNLWLKPVVRLLLNGAPPMNPVGDVRLNVELKVVGVAITLEFLVKVLEPFVTL